MKGITMNSSCTWGLYAAIFALLSGCSTVVAVADAAVSTAVTVTSTVVNTGIKATGAIVDAVIPSKK
jgi:uncharacterized protein YceK